MDVELKPEWTARLSGNLLNTTSCRGADHHQSIRSPRSLCSRTLSFRMYKAMKCCRGYQNGHAYRSTKHGGTHVTDANIYKHTRSKANALKCCAVGTQRHLVVATTRVVVPSTWFHPSLGKDFIVRNVYWFHFFLIEHTFCSSAITIQ